MRRKSNLFYITGTDSDFLTFSNYTEAMTGNFLATDVKLFPSKFLCLNIPRLTVDNREDFIKGLAAAYENKQAFLRDMCAYRGYDVEKKCKPLGWLLDYIYNYDSSFTVEYAGQVTEQDYNGIFADTICVIDSTDCTYADVVRSEDPDKTSYEDYSGMSQRYLYGWYDTLESTGGERYTGPAEYAEVTPVTDEGGKMYYMPVTERLDIIHPSFPRDITFNVIIPLFDTINIDHTENTDVIQDMTVIDCIADYASVINVPYGIWFSKEFITLTRDGTPWSPTWSLAIGSQFKPFPYSQTPISEVDQAAKAAAFMTFAQALVRQNKLLSKINDMSVTISYLSNRISDVEANLKSIGTSYNIDGLHAEMAEHTSYVANMLSYMQEEIDALYTTTN